MLSYTFPVQHSNGAEGDAPKPPGHFPVERHPAADDWGMTIIAILIMSLIAFAALGILVKQSFRLVPTGVMALRTLVNGRHPPAGHHELAADEEEQGSAGDGAVDRRRLELLSDNEDDSEAEDDARVLHIRTSE